MVKDEARVAKGSLKQLEEDKPAPPDPERDHGRWIEDAEGQLSWLEPAPLNAPKGKGKG